MTAAQANIKPLVFFHVMKCGGTSMRAAFSAGARAPFVLHGNAARDAAGGFLAQAENWRFRSELLSYLLSVGDHDVILGHFRYDKAHAARLDDAHFVTVLRPPAARFASLYNYRRSRPQAEIPADMPFEHVLEDPAWQAFGNTYVSTFCGDPELDPGSDEAIEKAIANLGRFAAVGSLAALDGFAAEVAVLVDRPIAIAALNRGPVDQVLGGNSPEHRTVLEEICRPDQRIYDAFFGPDGAAN